jgi:cell division septation protein DedD
MKRWLIAAAAAAGVMLLPSTASAGVCGDDGTTDLLDSQSYIFDFAESESATADHNEPFASLYDGGQVSPPAPSGEEPSDSWDEFGALFVGGTDDSHMYFSADNNSCTDDLGGRDHVFPVVTIGGLQVQRKIYVPTAGLPGARILNLVTNPSGAPVTTTVQVGDLTSTNNDGDLGSDGDTATRATSSGDGVATPADFWAVTNDDPDSPGDPTLAHIVDGHGAVKANLFQIGGGTVVADAPEDNVAWGWTVTVPAHATVGLMSYEVQQAVYPRNGATEVNNAVGVANAYESAPLATLYEGMSPAEAASVANWPQPPVPHKKKCKKHKKHHGKKSAAAAKKHKKSKKCKRHKKKHHK